MFFRFSARHLFATFPKCDVAKEVALERIVRLYPVEWALVGRELHEDGTPHLHAVIRFSRVYTTSDANHFDAIGDGHGNYQSARSIKRCIAYCSKDGDTCSHGDVPKGQSASAGSGRVAPSTRAAKMIMEGKSLSEVREEEPGFYLTHVKHCRALFAEIAAESSRSTLDTWPGIGLRLGAPSCEIKLNRWLDNNLFAEREFKQPQLFLYGPPNIGKTSLINSLSKYCSVYYVPNDEDFYDGYMDKKYDLIVIDEFKAQKKITWLNLFLQGGPTPLRQKGNQYLKTDNLPVIVLSNYSLEECYNHSSDTALDALRSRLEILEWTAKSHINLHLAEFETPLTPTQEVDESPSPPPTPRKRKSSLERIPKRPRALSFDCDE